MDVDEFLLLARSNLWSDRVRAGGQLSAHAGDATVDPVLEKLLLDAEDTAVIAGTADALLARGDLAAWRIFVAAWTVATSAQADHLAGSLSQALFAASLKDGEARRIREVLATLSTDEYREIRDTVTQSLSRVARALPE